MIGWPMSHGYLSTSAVCILWYQSTTWAQIAVEHCLCSQSTKVQSLMQMTAGSWAIAADETNVHQIPLSANGVAAFEGEVG
ncbi:hypothetical protein BS17DRAFT_602535 [Gyrodon lividus]|nr:hypothetical protein BS17DRAFT_602535 [Gyrodon lividus]